MTDLDTYIARRAALLAAWEAWENQPGNHSRVEAMSDACVAYAGLAANDLRKTLAAQRRAGATYEQALNIYENEW